MNGDQNRPPDKEIDIPEDAYVVKQVQYAWLWSSMPWILVLALLYNFGIIPEPIIASAVILVITVPRYLMWRGTAYILTEDVLIYQRGGITGSTKFQIPMARLTDVRSRDGNFGRLLGYQAVDILLDNGARASLTYVPVPNDIEGQLRQRMEAVSGPPDDAGENEKESESSEKPERYDPDASAFDPDTTQYDPDEPPADKPPRA